MVGVDELKLAIVGDRVGAKLGINRVDVVGAGVGTNSVGFLLFLFLFVVGGDVMGAVVGGTDGGPDN